MKNAPHFREHPLFLIALLLACTVFFTSCIGDTSSNSSPTSPASNAQTSAITPIGAQTTCLTLHPPSLVKLADGNYQLVDEIDNCGAKDAGPLKITTQIVTETTKQSTRSSGASHSSGTWESNVPHAHRANGWDEQRNSFPFPRIAICRRHALSDDRWCHTRGMGWTGNDSSVVTNPRK